MKYQNLTALQGSILDADREILQLRSNIELVKEVASDFATPVELETVKTRQQEAESFIRAAAALLCSHLAVLANVRFAHNNGGTRADSFEHIYVMSRQSVSDISNSMMSMVNEGRYESAAYHALGVIANAVTTLAKRCLDSFSDLTAWDSLHEVVDIKYLEPARQEVVPGVEVVTEKATQPAAAPAAGHSANGGEGPYQNRHRHQGNQGKRNQ